MAYRKKLNKKKSRRNFKRGTKINRKNLAGPLKRGGIRL